MVGHGHDHVLGLTSAEVAEVLAVAERCLVDALVEPSLAAQSAMPAGGEEAGHDTVTRLETLDLGADVLNHTDELVPQDRALVHGCMAVEDVKV